MFTKLIVLQKNMLYYMNIKGIKMDLSKQKEYISIAYIRALASQSQAFIEEIKEDSDSVDVRLKKKMISPEGFEFWGEIALQLKATNSSNLYHEDSTNIYYQLKVKNYNELRLQSVSKKYLGLLILPEKDWLDVDIDRMIIKRCMYWISLLDFPETDNSSNIQMVIPKANQLTSDVINDLLLKSL